MTGLHPLYVALTGARDRAKHEQTPVGTVALKAAIDIHMCVIAKATPNDPLTQAIEQLQINAMRVIEYTLKVMANDISKLTGCDVPASMFLKPNAVTAITPEDEGTFHEYRQLFLADNQANAEAMNALSGVTERITKQWAAQP